MRGEEGNVNVMLAPRVPNDGMRPMMLFASRHYHAGLPAAREPPDAHLAGHRVALPVLPHLEDDPLRLRDGRRQVGQVARMDGGRPAGLTRTHRTQLLRQLPHLRPALMD